MKKIRIILSIVLVLSVFTFVGCNNNPDDNNVTDETTTTTTTTTEATSSTNTIKDDVEDLGEDVKDGLDPNATTGTTR